MAIRYPGSDSLYLHPYEPGGLVEKRVQTYIKSTEQFFEEIESWLTPLLTKGVSTSRGPHTFLYWDAHYEVPLLNIDYDGRRLQLIPSGVSMRTWGLIQFSMELENRESDSCGVTLTQQNKEPYGWFGVIRGDRGLPKYEPFTQARFLEIMHEVFGL